jgi:multisubunit Na+/H+ antiporter MnhB subunit
MIVLVLAIVALYVKKLAGPWRGTYVVTVMLAYYFNFFVLVAQSFAKVPALHSIAPTQASPGFGFSQAAVLVIFILLTTRAFKKFHPV